MGTALCSETWAPPSETARPVSDKQTLSGREILLVDEEAHLISVDEKSTDWSMTLQLAESVYCDAWLAPLVGLFGDGARGRTHPWKCSLLLLFVNLVIQGMLLVRIGGQGGLLDEAQARRDQLLREPGETDIADGLCEEYRNENFDKFAFPSGVAPLGVGELTADCSSIDTRFTHGFGALDLDGDGNWTAREALVGKARVACEVDLAAIHANILNAVRKAALAVRESERYAGSLGALHQAQAVLDQLARRNDSITREVFETQVEPFSPLCQIGDPNLCGNFFLRGTMDRDRFLEPLRSRGFAGLPLLFVADHWLGSDEVHDASMLDVCRFATDQICPSLLSAREAQFREIVKAFCGTPSFVTHEATVAGVPSTSVLVTEYAAWAVYADTVLTWMYIGFLALILMFWILSMLGEFNRLLKWWRIHCGLLCRSGYLGRGEVLCKDGAIEVVSVPKWYAAWALLTNIVPRTAIFLTLTVLGTKFLLLASSYQDLIMNCVALTFLISLDEIMFMALVPEVRREWVQTAKPLALPPQPKFDWALHHVVNEVFWMAFIAAALVATLYWEYMRPHYGKFDLGRATKCLCVGAGRGCALANKVGGYPDVPTALAAKGA